MGQDNPRVVLVTGGSGLVGHALQDVVGTDGNSQDQWHFVGSKDVDLRDAQQTRELFERVRPTHVIHLAALVGGLFHNLNRKVDFFRDNMAIDDSVLQSCQLLGVQKLISCLSTCVFPADTTYPLDETMLHNGRPPISNEGYAMTKRLIDTLNRCYADQFGCNFTSVIPPPPTSTGHTTTSTWTTAMWCPDSCTNATWPSETRRCWWSGAVASLGGSSSRVGMWPGCCSGRWTTTTASSLSVDEEDEVSIGDVAREIAAAMEFKGEIVFDASRADGQFKKTASNAKLRRLIPDFRFTPISEGERTCFEANYKNARK